MFDIYIFCWYYCTNIDLNSEEDEVNMAITMPCLCFYLQAYSAENNLSIKEFSKRTGISKQQLKKIVLGERVEIYFKHLMRFAELYEMTVSDFIWYTSQ
jgi:DNA-binding Xre family transcriptional regulator